MKYLVDTHLLIWTVLDSAKLSDKAKNILEEDDNEYYFSAASVWEIALKRQKHPEQFPFTATAAKDLFLAAGFIERAVSSKHSAAVEDLPHLHGDPFDRLLVAQAQCDGMKLLTHDRMIVQYGDVAVEV